MKGLCHMANQKSSTNAKEKAARAKKEMLRIIRDRIVDLRDRGGLNQSEIATKCQMTPDRISKYLNDPKRGEDIPLETAMQFYFGLEIPIGLVIFSLESRLTLEGFDFLANFRTEEITKIGSLSPEEKQRFYNVIRSFLGLPELPAPIPTEKIQL
jgi:transcriptional regulator with XRE-family HTH domain